MLSKVLARADRSRAQLAVFPAVGKPTAPAAPDATSTSEAKWRERVHDLKRNANRTAWHVLRIEARNAAFQAGGHDHRVPELPSVLRMENARTRKRSG